MQGWKTTTRHGVTRKTSRERLKSDSQLPKKNLHYLLHWTYFKNDEKYFLFHLKSSFRSQDI